MQYTRETCTDSGDDTIESGLEPRDGVLGSDLVLVTDSGLLLLPLGDTHTRSAHDDVEVHSEDTNSRVVLDSEVNVLLDTESEVSGLFEMTRMRGVDAMPMGKKQRSVRVRGCSRPEL